MNPGKPFAAAALGTLVILGVDCGDNAQPQESQPEVVASVTLSPDTTVTNAIGDTAHFTATIRNSQGQALQVAPDWSVTDTTVAGLRFVINTTAYLETRRRGASRVIASSAGMADTATLVVRQIVANIADAMVTDTAFVPDTFELNVLGLDSNGVQVVPAAFSWKSSDTSVAVADSQGLAVARGGGTTSIFAAASPVNAEVLRLRVDTGRFALVAAAPRITCAARASRMTYCWGGRPSLVDTTQVWRALSGGGGTHCGLSQDGTAYCWGGNSQGELGTGDREPRAAPTPVATGLKFTTISSANSACAVTPQRAAYCWGPVSWASDTGWVTPQPLDSGVQFVDVQIADHGGCGLTPAGTAYCWGDFIGSDPAPVTNAVAFKQIAVAASALTQCVQVSDTDTYCAPFACGLSLDGAPYCWGADRMAGPAAVQTTMRFDTIVAGGNFGCGLRSGTAYCWGSDRFGQLGDSTTSATPADLITGTPVPVAGGHTFQTISAAGGHACGIPPTGDVIYCWGINEDGEVGSRYVPCPGTTVHCTTYPTRVTRGRSLRPK